MKNNVEIKGQALELAGLVGYSRGAIVSKTLLDKKTGTLTVFSFDKGQGLSEHTSPYDATVLVLEGEGVFTVGGENKTVKKGALIIMPATVPHSVKADKRFKMLLIMIR